MKSFLALALSALASITAAQCGSGTPNVLVSGSGTYTTTKGGSQVYSGTNYLSAINAGLSGISSGQRIVVSASGNIGASTISIPSGVTFEGCGTITAAYKAGRGAIESLNTQNTNIPYLNLAGAVYFGMRFYGVSGLKLGIINMSLTQGLGIRFERDEAASSNVAMDTITVSGATSHAVETWNINGLTINKVIARNVGECGLLLQTTTNARVNLVDANNAGAGTGYAALRFANRNGRIGSSYATNVYIDKLIATGGGRGLFCVSESGGAEINSVQISNTGNNAILLENCYNLKIKSGTVSGGGEVRISARSEFSNTRDTDITLNVSGTSVRESPCADNSVWNLSGSGTRSIC